MGLGTQMLLGGALQGLGAGIAAKGVADAEERRQIALENLRADNSREAAATAHSNGLDTQQKQFDLSDRNASRQNERQTNSQIIIENKKTDNDIKRDGVLFNQQKEQKKIDFNRDKELIALRAAAARASSEAQAKFQDALNSDDYSHTIIGDDDQYYTVYKNGTYKPTDIFAKASAESGTSPIGRVTGGDKTPKSEPRSGKGSSKPAKAPKIGTVIDGYRYKGGDPSSPNSWIKMK